MSMGILAVANQKGGVGKTTTAVTLAHGAAISGKTVLLVDLDSQGNVADCLGLPEGNELYHLLAPGDGRRPIGDFVLATGREKLDVIRSGRMTATLKMILAGDEFAVYRLNDVLKEALYDLIILDCAPSVDLLQTAAILASDYVLIPARPDQLAVKGVRDVLKSMKTVQERTGWKILLAGILPTFYDQVTKESQQQLVHLVQTFRKRVLAPIPVDVHCREASRYGKTLWEFNPKTRAIVGVPGHDGRLAGGYAMVLGQIHRFMKEEG
jgi:chromosome partitioning protein